MLTELVLGNETASKGAILGIIYTSKIIQSIMSCVICDDSILSLFKNKYTFYELSGLYYVHRKDTKPWHHLFNIFQRAALLIMDLIQQSR